MEWTISVTPAAIPKRTVPLLAKESDNRRKVRQVRERAIGEVNQSLGSETNRMTGRMPKTGDIQRQARTVIAHFRRHGSKAGFRMLLGDTLGKADLLQIGVFYTLPDFVEALGARTRESSLEVRPLDPDEIRLRASRKEDWFFQGAVDQSLAKADLCMGGFRGDMLVCSSWFTVHPIRVLNRMLHLPNATVFEYRIFTKPRYRGQGLAAALKLPAARIYADKGFTSFLNSIVWTNDASRRLHERMGYRRCGAIVKLGTFDRLTHLLGPTLDGMKLAPIQQG